MIYVVTESTELFPNDVFQCCNLEFALTELNKLTYIGCDTETRGFDPYTHPMVCTQLGNKENQFIFPAHSVDINSIKPLLENSEKTFLFANAKFDLRFFLYHNIKIKNLYDVFLAECVLTTGYDRKKTSKNLESDIKETSLQHLAFTYCGAKLDKDVRGLINIEGLSTRVIKYAAEDVVYLEDIMNQQLEKIKELELENVVDLENSAVIAFANLEFNGIKVNTTKWLEVAEQVKLLRKQHTKNLDNILLSDASKYKKFLAKYTQESLFTDSENVRKVNINWTSPAQKLKVLQVLNPKITSTEDRELQRIKRTNPIAKELIDFNKFNKLADSFGDEFLQHVNPKTGRVHCDIWQILSTGRISVSNPNLNQIPSKGDFGKLLRSCFIAEEGNSIVGGDYSGMELRIIAEFSQDPVWLDAYDNGKDLHSVLCAMTFGIDIADVKKPFPQKPDITYRDIQKTINFGLAYGMSEFKLSDTMGIEVKEAKAIIDKFFKSCPKVKIFLDELGRAAKQNGYIRTGRPYRRIRYFPRHTDAVLTQNFAELGNIERAGKNTPIQGTNGDIIKYALYLMQSKIDEENLPIQILLSVYDEIRTECPDNMTEWWRDEMNKIMIVAAQKVLKRVPIELDCKISKCWEK